MTNSGDAAETVVRVMLTGTEITLRLTASAAQNPNEKDPKGYPRHPGIPHDQGTVPGVPEESQALPAALCVHPG